MVSGSLRLAGVPGRRVVVGTVEAIRFLAWYREVKKADWDTPATVKKMYGNASIVGGNRVIFNVKGNDYRLLMQINYRYRVVYIRFVGTHAGYDGPDVEEV